MKLLNHLIPLLLGVVISVNSIGQTNCPQKAKVRSFVRMADSLSLFMERVKITEGKDPWSNFVNAVENDGYDAFDEFGSRGQGYKDTALLIIDSISALGQALTDAIAEDSDTPESIRDSIASLVACFLSDTVENTVDTLIRYYGLREAPVEIGNTWGCESVRRACLNTAEQNHLTALTNCLTGGSALGLIWKRTIGLWVTGACLVGAEINFNNHKLICWKDWCECFGTNPPQGCNVIMQL